MIKEAIVLVEEFGNLLKSKTEKLPKSITPIKGKPLWGVQLSHKNTWNFYQSFLFLGFETKTKKSKKTEENYLNSYNYFIDVNYLLSHYFLKLYYVNERLFCSHNHSFLTNAEITLNNEKAQDDFKYSSY